MQFYNTTNTYNSLVHETWKLCDADINSYPLADVTRRFNLGMEELVGEIINADGTWQYDDTNHADLPVGTGNLVEAQESYSFSAEYLQVESIKVKDKAGDWQIVQPLDPEDIRFIGTAIEEYFSATGIPEYYDIIGDTIRLYPAPTATAVTLTNGLKVNFKRAPDLFTTSDTTQEPGIPSSYHVLLAYYGAIPYCASYKKDRVAWLEKKYMEGKKQLLAFYGQREKDRRKIMRTSDNISHR